MHNKSISARKESNVQKLLMAVYYIVVVHNINLQEKTTSTVEVTTNFVEKFKVHFEKKLLY